MTDNLMLWGLPRKSSLDEDDENQGNVFNFEIRHNLPIKKSKYNSDQPRQDGDNLTTLQERDFLSDSKKKHSRKHKNRHHDKLEVVDEKDFLAPDTFDNSYQERYEKRRNRIHGLHKHSEMRPVATRVILTRKELEKKIEELKENDDDAEERDENIENQLDEISRKQRREEELIKKIFMSLMTPSEKRKVFGEE